MFCMFPDSKSEWKKGATGQSFIRKEITSYRIGTLIDNIFIERLGLRLNMARFWALDGILDWDFLWPNWYNELVFCVDPLWFCSHSKAFLLE